MRALPPLAAMAAVLALAGCETPRQAPPSLATLPSAGPARAVTTEAPTESAYQPDATGWRIEGAILADAPGETPASPVRSFSVRFDRAPVAAVVDAVIGQTLNRSYRIDPSVQGDLTLSLTGRMSEADALASLDRALRSQNAALVREGPGYAVVPASDARRSGAEALNGAVAYQARHVSAAELVRLLEPLAGEAAMVRADPLREQVHLSGDPDAVSALLRAARSLDTDWLQGRSFQFFPVRYATPAQLAGELRQVMGGEEGVLAGQLQLLEMERLNGLLVVARSPAGLDRAAEWILRLDRPAAPASRRFRSIPLSNLEAGPFVQTLSVLMGEGAGQESSAPPGAPIGQNTDAAPATSATASATVGGLRLTADPRTNAIIMFADDAEYRGVLEIVRELDTTPPQVLIEATIAEVTLNDRLRFGVQWFFENDELSGGFGSAANDTAAASYPGLAVRYLGTDVRAVLNTLSTVTDVQLISTPRILVLSNESAELQVGDQVPIITQTATGLQEDSRIINSVQYRDTGVVLSVTPRVSDSGRMFIDIAQEVSEVAGTTTSEIDSPTIQQRRLATRVQVEDGQLLVLAGLMRSTTSTGDTGIPYLSRAPVVGALFRARDVTERQTELVMFLRPTVMRERRDVDVVAEEMLRRLESLGFRRDAATP